MGVVTTATILLWTTTLLMQIKRVLDLDSMHVHLQGNDTGLPKWVQSTLEVLGILFVVLRFTHMFSLIMSSMLYAIYTLHLLDYKVTNNSEAEVFPSEMYIVMLVTVVACGLLSYSVSEYREFYFEKADANMFKLTKYVLFLNLKRTITKDVAFVASELYNAVKLKLFWMDFEDKNNILYKNMRNISHTIIVNRNDKVAVENIENKMRETDSINMFGTLMNILGNKELLKFATTKEGYEKLYTYNQEFEKLNKDILKEIHLGRQNNPVKKEPDLAAELDSLLKSQVL